MTEVALPARHATQGARIRAARIAAGMTEAGLADALEGGSATAVAKWELGQSQPHYWLRPKLCLVLRVPYFRVFVPEEVANSLLIGPRRLLLSAHHLRGHSENWYVETGRGAERTNANWLAKDWLIEDAGQGPRRGFRLWQLTLPGLDVLDCLKAEQ